ncbi:DUF2062 domain-containing protein [Zoogloea sp.]|jgi:uncharacterized protein (DUF2062 family)|uniref:DUF2062 domain-containing protein n=1 Tax=Zoogloea sp. TaxID=49181 RepID=UPI002BDA26A6|nr:DUF2062 domain-containing protein [Zoogloea sp.]HPI60522.1 DUF2062 domain-containing protein [Zoogloea sp.]
MRRLLKRYLPDHASLATNRWLAPFGSTLFHPRLWHLNRHSAAGAIATGLFCGLIPGPFQMLGAALGCVLLRVNLPLALLTTLYTNPFTIVPLYILAFSMGEALLGRGEARFTPPPEWSGGDVLGGVAALADWMIALGRPLALGLVVLASSLALAGYLLTRIAWRTYLIHHWRKRRQR